MQLLIAHGARLDLPNVSGIAPVMAAAGYGSVECDPRGYGPGIPHYMTADVEQKSIEALTVLLDAGADVDHARPPSAGAATAAGQTALFGAAFWGWNDVVNSWSSTARRSTWPTPREDRGRRRAGRRAATSAARRSRCSRTRPSS